MSGTIESIHVAQEAAGPVRPVGEATLRRWAGIDGDRVVQLVRGEVAFRAFSDGDEARIVPLAPLGD